MSEDVEINLKPLEQLLKALKGKQPTARVGILGGGGTRGSGTSETTATNATIGAAHEFGTSRIPQRSFLRIPISEQLDKSLMAGGDLDPTLLAEVVKQGSVIPWLRRIAVIAEGIVAEAFETGGFGKWPSWKTKGYQNNTGQLLVDTAQLRNSITSEVKE